MSRSIADLRKTLAVPLSGRIDFDEVLGSSLSRLLDRWRKGHFPMPTEVVRTLNFDDVLGTANQPDCVEIDNHYQPTHGVRFSPWLHTYDAQARTSGFEPCPGRWVGVDHPTWYDPHVYAVRDSVYPQSRYSLSPPGTLNVGDTAHGGPGQLMTAQRAIRIDFDVAVGAVNLGCDYRIHHEDKDRPIWNWPQMLAYDATGKLLDQVEAPYGGQLCVSSWAGDIAYVMVTVNNHWAGVEPYGIFDDLSWTRLEFVLRTLSRLRSVPRAVPRGQAVDEVQNRLAEIQATEQRLARRLAKLDAGELTAQLLAELSALTQQTESLRTHYQRLTKLPAVPVD
jgi:hypothetical protein